MNILDNIKKLNLPPEEYVVCGSGVLGALAIRDPRDIDLAVSKDLFNALIEKGWECHNVICDGKPSCILSLGIIEAYTEFRYRGRTIPFEDLKRRSQLIEGVPFVSLSQILEIKEVFDRDKDRKDVDLIKSYIESREEWIAKLSNDGYRHIYERIDPPFVETKQHIHLENIALYIISGSITFYFYDKEIMLQKGDSFVIPAREKHHSIVGDMGCVSIVADMEGLFSKESEKSVSLLK